MRSYGVFMAVWKKEGESVTEWRMGQDERRRRGQHLGGSAGGVQWEEGVTGRAGVTGTATTVERRRVLREMNTTRREEEEEEVQKQTRRGTVREFKGDEVTVLDSMRWEERQNTEVKAGGEE